MLKTILLLTAFLLPFSVVSEEKEPKDLTSKDQQVQVIEETIEDTEKEVVKHEEKASYLRNLVDKLSDWKDSLMEEKEDPNEDTDPKKQ